MAWEEHLHCVELGMAVVCFIWFVWQFWGSRTLENIMFGPTPHHEAETPEHTVIQGVGLSSMMGEKGWEVDMVHCFWGKGDMRVLNYF
jgi:hypothetical protein